MSKTMQTKLEIHRGADRGKTEIGWLKGRHSFSFGRYYDPSRMGYRALRVINDDVIAPGQGFGQHGHDNMEIITWVLEGEIAHKDSTGTSGVIRPGDAQLMSAGRGIMHSEMNASTTDASHLLQIWIEPGEQGLAPSYQQKAFPREGRRNKWQTIASPKGGAVTASTGPDQPLVIHQDASLSIAELDKGASLDLSLSAGRHGYLHVAFGSVRVGDVPLSTGDSATFKGEAALTLNAAEATQLVMFDLA